MRRLRRLVNKRSLRWSEGVCVLEGPDLIDAALEAGVEFEAIYVDVAEQSSETVARRSTPSAVARRASLRTCDRGARKDRRRADPSTVARDRSTPDCRFRGMVVSGLVLVLHDVRDPGNAGTIIRSADAAGVSAVIFSGQSVDPFNPKALRASAGSVFHVPVCVSPLEDATRVLLRGRSTYARHGRTRWRESPRAGFLGADGGRHRQRGDRVGRRDCRPV